MTPLLAYLHWPRVSYRCWKVWMRNRDVYMQTYKSNFVPPLLEPILFMVALGFTLGRFVQLGGFTRPVLASAEKEDVLDSGT